MHLVLIDFLSEIKFRSFLRLNALMTSTDVLDVLEANW
jgi:hypothetical protein